jgi:hypothetical protein
MELMKLARATVDEFAEIPTSAKDEVVQDLVDGLEAIFEDYISFVSSCGTLCSFIFSRITQNLSFQIPMKLLTHVAQCAWLVEKMQGRSRATSLLSRL